jgi:dienelactone hydrolase
MQTTATMRAFRFALYALLNITTALPAQRNPTAALGDQAFGVLKQFLAYDPALPLNVVILEKYDSATFMREKFAFDGWRYSRVPGLIATPKNGNSKHPIIVLIDGIGGWKERWWQRDSWNRGRVLIDQLLQAGYAVVMVDAPSSGERRAESDFVDAIRLIRTNAQLRDLIYQAALEHRRLLDYLATRSDIDTLRIGALGLSLGGMISFQLATVEPRIRSIVPGLTPLQDIPDLVWPGHFAPRVTVPTLMLMGRTDPFYTALQTERLLESIPAKDKQLIWYDVGHRLPEDYAAAALQWFQRHLR